LGVARSLSLVFANAVSRGTEKQAPGSSLGSDKACFTWNNAPVQDTRFRSSGLILGAWLRLGEFLSQARPASAIEDALPEQLTMDCVSMRGVLKMFPVSP